MSETVIVALIALVGTVGGAGAGLIKGVDTVSEKIQNKNKGDFIG